MQAMPTDVTPGLQIRELTCSRGERLLFEGLSFAITPGTGLHVIGPNGSGKTTLLRTLCGLGAPDGGRILWQGADTREYRPEFLRQVAFVGHAHGVKEDLTLFENLAFARALAVPADPYRPRDALARVGLAGFEEELAGTLSAGQRRRLALARLLVIRATVWILDEPFNALDGDGIEAVEALIAAHLAHGGLVVLTSHQPLQSLRDRVDQLRLAS